VKEGDRILFGEYSGTEVRVDNQDYLILREDEISGILTHTGKAGGKKWIQMAKPIARGEDSRQAILQGFKDGWNQAGLNSDTLYPGSSIGLGGRPRPALIQSI
jgi:hypothetical protein